jgi:hypothetical protein
MPWMTPYIEYLKTFGREDFLNVCESTKTKRTKNLEIKANEKINIKNKVKELRNRGLKVKEISKILNLSMSQVNRRLK